jgi:hypothetical protein
MGKIQSSGEIRMTRRSVLCGALVTVTVAAARTVLAQQMQTHLPPRVVAKPKGPLVFLDYDKEEIDLAYDQAPWAPNRGEVAKRNAQKSAAALARLGQPRRRRLWLGRHREARHLYNEAAQRADQCFYPWWRLAQRQCKGRGLHVRDFRRFGRAFRFARFQ